MTVEEARAIYLALEGASEGEHHGHPDFRVGNKIFATLWPGKSIGVLRLPLGMAEAAAAEDSERRRIVSRSGGMGWLQVDLEAMNVAGFIPLAEFAFEARRTTRSGA